MKESAARAEPIRHPKAVDMRGNNRFQDLLEIYAKQSEIMSGAKSLKDAAHKEIMTMMAGADEAVVDGFLVWCTTVERKEYVMKAATLRQLRIRRTR